MRAGIWVLNIFAALWAVAAIVVGHLPTGLAILPIAISVVLLMWGSRQPIGTGNPIQGNHVGRVVGIATGVEIVALIIASNVLLHLHLPSAVIPVSVIIVGLHFFPLARYIPVKTYYWTSGGLLVVGLVGLAFSPSQQGAASGFAASLVLWASGIALVRRGRD